MVRTQIQLPEDAYRRLKELAARRGVSISALVRDGVDRVLQGAESDERWRRLLDAAGTCHDPTGATDVADRHDEFLADIYGA